MTLHVFIQISHRHPRLYQLECYQLLSRFLGLREILARGLESEKENELALNKDRFSGQTDTFKTGSEKREIVKGKCL